MKSRSFLFLLLILLLAGCNLPAAPSAVPTPDAVATQVSLLLTQVPTATTAPVTPASATQASESTATATEPVPTSTMTSTLPAETPTLTPTTAPTDANDPPDWQDTLDGGKAFYRFENDNTRVTQEGGHLALTGITANGWLGWSLTYSHKPADFRLEATFIPQACSGSDIYGLVFRAPNENAGYFFGITCGGSYNFHSRDFANDVDTVLVNSTNAAAILPGANQTNRLAVRAQGDKISLYVNGALLQEITDSSYTSGSFGAFVAANETSGFTVWMDEIALWNIP